MNMKQRRQAVLERVGRQPQLTDRAVRGYCLAGFAGTLGGFVLFGAAPLAGSVLFGAGLGAFLHVAANDRGEW